MTLKEYLEDYASPETKRFGEEVIASEIGNIPREKVREIVEDNLKKIEKGNRDFRL
jgi:2-iminoacetate synthase